MKLAIKGHPERGKEVIKLLEMLEGKISSIKEGDQINQKYYISKKGKICCDPIDCKTEGYNHIVYSLERFEKEFPYKVGEVVTYFDRNNKTIHLLIQNIRWNPTKHGGTVEYVLQNGVITTGENLKPMKKELKDYLKPGYVVEFDDGSKFVITQDVHGNNFGLQLGADIMWADFIHLDGIVKVYQINKPGALHKTFTYDTHLTLVWEKPKEVELTMQEIADKFGIDVNQLKIKK